MLSFSIYILRNTTEYKAAIMQGYKFNVDYNDYFLKFNLKKGEKETSYSGKVQTLKQFRDQLLLFITELNN